MSVAEEIVASDAAPAGSYARKALAASAVGYAMNGFDFLILGFMMSAIARDLGLGATAGASLATFTLIGAVVGGFIFGMLADAYGRVRVTGLSAFAQGYWDLVVYRTIAGLGLGGEFGIGMALVAEAWPASQRARASSYVGLGWQAGVFTAASITPVLTKSGRSSWSSPIAADEPDGAAHRRRDHGPVRQRHARRLWRAHVGAISHECAGDRAERAV
jgi:MFS family permease